MYLILDCCFAGSAVDSFQGASDELITIQSDKLPTGVALLNASSRHAAAVVPEGSVYTMFSGCLVEVLKKGIPNGGPLLSLREVRNAVAEAVIAKYPDPVRPEVHSPRQRDGDPADIPLFPNPSYVERAPREGGETPGISVLNIAQVYNFPTSLSGKGECVGIITLGGDGYRKSDLQTYFAGLRLSMPRIDSMYIAGATGGTSDGLGLHLTIQIEICGAIAPARRTAHCL
jgi:hypothetical protein